MRVLETDRSVLPVLEPDNEGTSAPAIWGKRHAGRFPVLLPGDRDDDYRALWQWALGGAPRPARLALAAQVMKGVQRPSRTRYLQGHRVPLMSVAAALGRRPPGHPDPAPEPGRRVLVKSVHVPLCLGWLAGEFALDVVVLLRHPGNVLASWLKLDLNEQFVRLEENPAVRAHFVDRWSLPQPGPDPLERVVWEIGVLTKALEEEAAAHPEWLLRTHEDLCRSPLADFEQVFSDLGLSWGGEAQRFLSESDQPGEGFETRRVRAQLPDAWRTKLTSAQIEVLRRVLAPFSFSTWSEADFAAAPRHDEGDAVGPPPGRR